MCSSSPVPRDLEHVEVADQVGLDIGARVLDRIAHAGLRAEMDDAVELLARRAPPRAPRRRRNRPGWNAKRLALSASIAASRSLLQRRPIIIVEVVDADHPVAARQQAADSSEPMNPAAPVTSTRMDDQSLQRPVRAGVPAGSIGNSRSCRSANSAARSPTSAVERVRCPSPDSRRAAPPARPGRSRGRARRGSSVDAIFVHRLGGVGERIVDGHVVAQRGQPRDQVGDLGVAQVGDVLLERQPQHQRAARPCRRARGSARRPSPPCRRWSRARPG